MRGFADDLLVLLVMMGILRGKELIGGTGCEVDAHVELTW